MFFGMQFKTKYLFIAIGVTICLILIVGYFYYQNQKSQNPKIQSLNTPAQAPAEQVQKITAEVEKLIELPQGEDPTVATVTDTTKLKDQPFFQKAKNGDKVLIYTNARKAILYDPVARKVIDMTYITLNRR